MTAKKKATKKGPSSADSEVDVDSIVDDGSGKPLDDQSTASDIKMLPWIACAVEELAVLNNKVICHTQHLKNLI